ncbi:MAG: hypothetical protein ABSF77_09705 [Spirochaetia bacterium]
MEKAEYEARRAERQYESIEPENRLAARTLEKRWNERLVDLQTVRAKAEEAGKNRQALTEQELSRVTELAMEFDDARIARVLNRKGRRTGNGNPFTADEAASELGVNLSTLLRWLHEGVLAGEQRMPGAPWRIVLTDEVRRRLTGGDAPEGWVSLTTAAKRLGLTTSHVSYLVKTRKLDAVRVTVGKRSRWRIDVSTTTCGAQPDLFNQTQSGDSKGA